MGEANPDVLIVGGGVMGLACAWRLAQRGLRTTILEENRCGHGASRAALGALWPSPLANAGPLQNLQRASLWNFEPFVRELRSVSGLAVDYRRHGKLEFLNSPRALENARRHVVAAIAGWPALDSGQVMEILNRDQVLAIEPRLNVAPHGAQFCRWSAQVEVEQILAALVAACRLAGVTIREGSHVDQIEIANDRACGARMGLERLAAGKVLLCAGVGTRLPDLSHTAEHPIVPVKGQALLLRAAGGLIGHIVKNGPIFLVPWPDGRILVGSTTEPEAGFDTTNTAAGVQTLLHGAVEICPELKTAALERIWAGLRPSGPGHRPLMGRVGRVENLFICAGHYKIGIGMAPLAAELMADLILTGKTPYDISEFAPT